MLRHLDIKLVVIASLGVAAFGLVFLLRNFSLNNIPDENVVYIDPAVGGIEANSPEIAEEVDDLEDTDTEVN